MSLNISISEEFPDLYTPRHIRILGAGRFGRIAAKRLKHSFPESSIHVTDSDSHKIERIRKELGISGDVADSILSIAGSSIPESVWLVPAVPVHVGFEWLLRELDRESRAKRIPVPEELGSQVPNPIRSPSGTVYASFATFICPDNCNEPSEICTRSGKPREGNLFQVFGSLRVSGFKVVVLRSWQLAPGVGGYPFASLKAILESVGSAPGKYLIGTSCRCHGVIDALEWAAP